MTRPLFARLEQEDDFQHWGQNLLRDLDSLFTTDGPALVLSREHLRMYVPLVGTIDGVNDVFTCKFKISRDPELNPYALIVSNGQVLSYPTDWTLDDRPNQRIVFTTPPAADAVVVIVWLLCRI